MSSMTLRDRILAVYHGETPDVVPFMLDLSHWYYWKQHEPWDLSRAYLEPEYGLIDYHRQVGAGFYIPNLGAMYRVSYPEGVRVSTEKRQRNGVPEIHWRLETAAGAIHRARIWEERTYAWGISHWGIRTPEELRVFMEAMANREYQPLWDRYRAWDQYVGDLGTVYLSAGYSAMGHLLNYWMGIEQVMYATVDYPEELEEAVRVVNANNLQLIDLLCESPASVILMGDNFSSDIQPLSFFREYGREYYVEAIRRLHAAGKKVAVHIDGRLRGALEMIRDVGADAGDAITPVPMGDLEPAECRREAGPDFILSGGVSPDLWLPDTPLEVFDRALLEWLDLRHTSPRLIAAAGDQVPPGADETRITRMRDLVEKHGRF